MLHVTVVFVPNCVDTDEKVVPVFVAESYLRTVAVAPVESIGWRHIISSLNSRATDLTLNQVTRHLHDSTFRVGKIVVNKMA